MLPSTYKPSKLVVDMFYCVSLNRRPAVLHISSTQVRPALKNLYPLPTLCQTNKVKEAMYPTDHQIVHLPICRKCELELALLDRG